MTDEVSIAVPVEIANAYESYLAAAKARARWAEEETALKAKILTYLGYEEDEEKPLPVTVVTPNGHEIFRVSIGSWRGMDFQYLKTNYPQVYAECERTKPTKALKPAS